MNKKQDFYLRELEMAISWPTTLLMTATEYRLPDYMRLLKLHMQ